MKKQSPRRICKTPLTVNKPSLSSIAVADTTTYDTPTSTLRCSIRPQGKTKQDKKQKTICPCVHWQMGITIREIKKCVSSIIEQSQKQLFEATTSPTPAKPHNSNKQHSTATKLDDPSRKVTLQVTLPSALLRGGRLSANDNKHTRDGGSSDHAL